MPDIAVHARMGAEVYEKAGLGVDRDIFAFGLLGPDPYLFDRFFVPPFRHPTNRYSSVMHRQRTGDFLVELAKRSSDLDVFAWLAGFLCHYALDADTHPYINEKAHGNIALHMAIEHRLDLLDGGEIRIPPFLPERLRKPCGGAITQIYGWRDAWEKLKEGHRHMGPFYRLVRDESGALNNLFGWTRSPAAMLSYKSRVCDGMDLSGFAPLRERAVRDALRYIAAAEAFVRGEMGEEELRRVIGSRSYIEG